MKNTTRPTPTPTPTPTPSLWQQWSQDATHAFQDLYGSWMLGDDAGQSAKLVVVVNGTKSAADTSSTTSVSVSVSGAAGAGAGAGASGAGGNSNSNDMPWLHHHHHSNSNSNSSPRHNGNQRHNHNHNHSNKHPYHHHHHPYNNSHHNPLAQWGVTFCEINGRAYVQTVEPDSPAAEAGVMPRDGVQYASILDAEWKDPLGDDFAEIRKYALEREEQGQRISYKKLKALLHSGVLMLQQQQQSSAKSTTSASAAAAATAGCLAPRSVPATIQVGNSKSIYSNPCGVVSLGRRTSTSTSTTNQRNTTTTTNTSSSTSSSPPPSAANTSTTSSSSKSPNAAAAAAIAIAAAGTHSTHATSTTRPLVLVFRRTKQRPMMSLPIWPHYRLDDECDVACQILQSLTTATTTSNSTGTSNTYNDNNHDSNETVEAATIRAMIQQAVGLAFLRSNKVVLGVSIHAGSGIVIARLPDGTWSAPSAIGIAGIGLGFQLGVEVAHSILILQTREALEHFQRGGSFTVGANVGAAVGAVGREAIGAASLSGVFCGMSSDHPTSSSTSSSHALLHMVKDDEYHDTLDTPTAAAAHLRRRGPHSNDDPNSSASASAASSSPSSLGVAPLVAYAKSQGLYVGLSLEGSRIHGRHDVNARTYQFETRKSVTAQDLLSGKVAPPPEADQLYEALHQVEFTHELQTLPRPPKALWGRTPWFAAATATAAHKNTTTTSTSSLSSHSDPFQIPISQWSVDDQEALYAFEHKFRELLYGGVPVWRVRGKKRERRILWLYVPEGSASLQLGFVSKLSNPNTHSPPLPNRSSIGNNNHNNNNRNMTTGGASSSSVTEMDDRRSVASEEVTLDSALMDNQSVWNTLNHPGAGVRTQVELSRKNSVALTHVIRMHQTVPSDVTLPKSEESRRFISLISQQSTTMASGGNGNGSHNNNNNHNNNTNALNFVAKSDQEAQVLMSGIKILLELETARCGVRGGVGKEQAGESSSSSTSILRSAGGNSKTGAGKKNKKHGFSSSSSSSSGGYSSSSEVEDNHANDDMSAMSIGDTMVPEEWNKSWGRVPGRNFLRGQAAANDHGYPQYVHGQLLVCDIAKNVHLPLPLPLCRVLLLDSSSPVISQWEKDRGDVEFEKTPWMFPPATPRERDQYQSSEHQLIASGSMCGAHRTISYQRPRNRQLVRLFETQIVDSDDSEKLAFQIHERMPRRGFSIKVKMILKSYGNECEATVLGEIRPVGKDMSNPEAVHKAFLLVVDELRDRYGPDGKGLLSGFLNAVNTFKEDDLSPHMNGSSSSSSFPRKNKKTHGSRFGEEKKEQDSTSSSSSVHSSSSSKSKHNHSNGKSIKLEDMLKANSDLMNDVSEPKSLQDRTPSPMDAKKYRESYRKPKPAPMPSDTFDAPATEPVMIEVKPLPKIRLSLMPSPREEDEFDLLDDDGDRGSRHSSNGSSSNGGGSGGGGSKSKQRTKKSSWGKRRPRKTRA